MKEVAEFAAAIPAGRVVVVDADGTVVADSCPPLCASTHPDAATDLDANFVLNRPEIQAALDPADPRTYADIRQSDALGQPLLVAAAPILDDTSVGAAAPVERCASHRTSRR